MEKINRPIIPPKWKISPELWKEAYAVIIKSCDQNMQLIFHGNIKRLADMELTLRPERCQFNPTNHFTCSQKYGLVRYDCVLYLQLLGGQFHFTFPLNPEAWEIHVFTTMCKSLFGTPTLHDMIHSLPTSDPSPQTPHRFFCCCQPASSSVRAASAFFLSDSGPVPIVQWIIDWFDTTKINYSMSKMYHSMKEQHDFTCHHKHN